MTVPTPTARTIERFIHILRGQKVMLDADLAQLYGVPTKSLNLAVKRNRDRFPADFMFRLTEDEHASLRSQIETSKGRGGRRYPPYAFTEHGVVMLANLLNSARAVAVSIEVVRVFVRLRQALAANIDLARQLDELERKVGARFAEHEKQLRVVFEAVRQLMVEDDDLPARKVGFEVGRSADDNVVSAARRRPRRTVPAPVR